MEYALQMLRNAAASDVTLLAVTPHCCGEDVPGWVSPGELRQRFLQLQAAAADIPVELVPGAELRLTDRLPELLERGTLPTIGGGRYLLTEFSFDSSHESCRQQLQSLLDHGYIPLIAHPERLGIVYADPAVAAQWVEMGCHLQLTGDSILGHFGRPCSRICEFLLGNDLVACVASDAHGINRRSNCLLEVYDHLLVHYSKAYANFLLSVAPTRICRDQDL
jgi:protein-tyrosine phosphatase